MIEFLDTIPITDNLLCQEIAVRRSASFAPKETIPYFEERLRQYLKHWMTLSVKHKFGIEKLYDLYMQNVELKHYTEESVNEFKNTWKDLDYSITTDLLGAYIWAFSDLEGIDVVHRLKNIISIARTTGLHWKLLSTFFRSIMEYPDRNVRIIEVIPTLTVDEMETVYIAFNQDLYMAKEFDEDVLRLIGGKILVNRIRKILHELK